MNDEDEKDFEFIMNIICVAVFVLIAIMMVIGHTYILPNVSMISTFLVFIACVTLPHIFVVDESYQQ